MQRKKKKIVNHGMLLWDRNRRLMDKGIEAVKRERSKTYFS